MYLLYIYLYVKYNICIYLPTAVIEIQKLLRFTLSIILMKCCALSFFFCETLDRSLLKEFNLTCKGVMSGEGSGEVEETEGGRVWASVCSQRH